jgi:hypothetical protein
MHSHYTGREIEGRDIKPIRWRAARSDVCSPNGAMLFLQMVASSLKGTIYVGDFTVGQSTELRLSGP